MMTSHWRLEYERRWAGYTTRVLSERFGSQYATSTAVTAQDRDDLVALLASLKAQEPGGNEDEQLDDGLEEEASYVYRTPPPAPRRRQSQGGRTADSMMSGVSFATSGSLDFDAAGSAEAMESPSQRLRFRLEGVSPIRMLTFTPVSPGSDMDCRQEQEQLDETRVAFDCDQSPVRTATQVSWTQSLEEELVDIPDDGANTGSAAAAAAKFRTPPPPRHPASAAAAAYRPMTVGPIQYHPAAAKTPTPGRHVKDLDVSMQSMHLSDNEAMDEVVPATMATQTDSATQQDASQGRRVAAILSFHSDDEDEDEVQFLGVRSNEDFAETEVPPDTETETLHTAPPTNGKGDSPAMDWDFHNETEAQPEPEAEEIIAIRENAKDLFADDEATAPGRKRLRRRSLTRRRVAKDRLRPQGLFQTKLPLELESRYAMELRRKRRRRRKSHNNKPGFPYRMPEFLVDLPPYQRDAVTWMHEREKFPKTTVIPNISGRVAKTLEQVRGGILADEMGLGKTVCCIALICESLVRVRESLHQKQVDSGSAIPRLTPPTLIITPLSILSQWESELREKTNLSVVTYQGNNRKRFRTAMEFMGADVVLSTYDTLRLQECKVPTTLEHEHDANEKQEREEEDDAIESVPREWTPAPRTVAAKNRAYVGSKLHQLSWYRVILDESHLITNSSCGRARAALSLQSKRRWCVTGTPIQNSCNDLTSLVKFIGVTHQINESELNDLVSHLMLRRLKTSVDRESNAPILVLPQKTEHIVELPFASPLEQAFYMLLHRSTKRQVIQYLQAQDTHAKPFMHVFELLLRLRQACDSIGLVTTDPLSEVQGSASRLLAEQYTLSRADAELLERVQASPADRTAPQLSTKIRALLEELDRVKAKGEKALVISQWSSFLDLIVDSFTRYNGQHRESMLSYGLLDGRMTTREREQVISAFQHEKRLDVLLISLRTGGLGLNLTTASHVFIMEPSWNPSSEDQAIDRAHRFGQEHPVRIVRFLIKDSIEQRVVELQRKKKRVAATFLGDDITTTPGSTRKMSNKPSRMSMDDLRVLFSQESMEE